MNTNDLIECWLIDVAVQPPPQATRPRGVRIARPDQ
jgi:hypothetical protein